MSDVDLRDHVRRFNQGVRTKDFSEMLDHFADDAELHFHGVPVGPFEGKDAIAAAYRDNPPDDEIVLITDGGDGGDYAWRSDPARIAGRIAIRSESGRITRLDVTFIEGEMGDA